jgi:hypothetical protein
MIAKLVFENLEFERGLPPKDSVGIGREGHLIKKHFDDAFSAADWAIRNLDLITNDEYSPNQVIRAEGHRKIPEKLTSYLMKWIAKVTLKSSDLSMDADIMAGPNILWQFATQLKNHGLLIENINFEKGLDPKESMGIGRTVNILGTDRKRIRGIVLDEISPMEVRIFWPVLHPAHDRVFKVETIKNGKKEIIFVAKFETLFGEYWGIKLKDVNESINFERGQKPYKSLRIGREAQAEKKVQDEDFVDDMIDGIDSKLETAMSMYLPYEKRKELVKRWILDSHEWKSLQQSEGDEEEIYDEFDKVIQPKINYEVADLEAEGWEVFHEENNFGQVEVILCREK